MGDCLPDGSRGSRHLARQECACRDQACVRRSTQSHPGPDLNLGANLYPGTTHADMDANPYQGCSVAYLFSNRNSGRRAADGSGHRTSHIHADTHHRTGNTHTGTTDPHHPTATYAHSAPPMAGL